MSGGPSIAVADGFAQLVAHVLAHVPLEQPGNLFDPRYLRWVAAHGPRGAREIVEHDAALLARCWRGDRSLDLLHGFCQLHRGLDEFRRTAGRELGQLDAREVRASGLLAAVRGVPAAELLHATLALVVDDFADQLATLQPELERARASIEPHARRLAALVPGFAAARVELVWALGRHGRAFADRILVGAPASWHEHGPARQAVLAAHEQLVRASEHHDYLGSEWDALTGLARCLHECEHLELRDAHASWVAGLELSELLTDVARRGWIEAARARELARERENRAAAFAQLRRRSLQAT